MYNITIYIMYKPWPQNGCWYANVKIALGFYRKKGTVCLMKMRVSFSICRPDLLLHTLLSSPEQATERKSRSCVTSTMRVLFYPYVEGRRKGHDTWSPWFCTCNRSSGCNLQSACSRPCPPGSTRGGTREAPVRLPAEPVGSATRHLDSSPAIVGSTIK